MKRDDLIARLRDAEAGTVFPLDALRDLLSDAAAALQRVADLHAHRPNCFIGNDQHCAHDGDDWPCPTIQALEGGRP